MLYGTYNAHAAKIVKTGMGKPYLLFCVRILNTDALCLLKAAYKFPIFNSLGYFTV